MNKIASSITISLLLLSVPAFSQVIRISQEPQTNTVGPSDDLLINKWNGVGYDTRRINAQSLITALATNTAAGSLASQLSTNPVVGGVITNLALTVATNGSNFSLQIGLNSTNRAIIAEMKAVGYDVTLWGVTPYHATASELANFSRATLPADQTANIQAVIDMAKTNSSCARLLFPEGVYRLTDALIFPTNVIIEGAGPVHFSDRGTLLMPGTLFWQSDTNKTGLVFTNRQYTWVKLRNFEVGGCTNPFAKVDYGSYYQGPNTNPTMANLPSSSFSSVGIDTTPNADKGPFCIGIDAENVSVKGFRIGVNFRGNYSRFKQVQMNGNDIGFICTNSNNGADDQVVFEQCEIGDRNRSIGYVLQGIRGWVWNSPCDGQYSIWGQIFGADMTINGGNSEGDSVTNHWMDFPAWWYAKAPDNTLYITNQNWPTNNGGDGVFCFQGAPQSGNDANALTMFGGRWGAIHRKLLFDARTDYPVSVSIFGRGTVLDFHGPNLPLTYSDGIWTNAWIIARGSRFMTVDFMDKYSRNLAAIQLDNYNPALTNRIILVNPFRPNLLLSGGGALERVSDVDVLRVAGLNMGPSVPQPLLPLRRGNPAGWTWDYAPSSLYDANVPKIAAGSDASFTFSFPHNTGSTNYALDFTFVGDAGETNMTAMINAYADTLSNAGGRTEKIGVQPVTGITNGFLSTVSLTNSFADDTSLRWLGVTIGKIEDVYTGVTNTLWILDMNYRILP
jgi:hypothetical protein